MFFGIILVMYWWYYDVEPLATPDFGRPTMERKLPAFSSQETGSTCSPPDGTRWSSCGSCRPPGAWLPTREPGPQESRSSWRKRCSTTQKTSSCSPTRLQPPSAAGTREALPENSCFLWDIMGKRQGKFYNDVPILENLAHQRILSTSWILCMPKAVPKITSGLNLS